MLIGYYCWTCTGESLLTGDSGCSVFSATDRCEHYINLSMLCFVLTQWLFPDGRANSRRRYSRGWRNTYPEFSSWYHELNSPFIHIMNWIRYIMDSIRDKCHVVRITNWIHDILGYWIHDIMISIRDLYISRIAFRDIMNWQLYTNTAFRATGGHFIYLCI